MQQVYTFENLISDRRQWLFWKIGLKNTLFIFGRKLSFVFFCMCHTLSDFGLQPVIYSCMNPNFQGAQSRRSPYILTPLKKGKILQSGTGVNWCWSPFCVFDAKWWFLLSGIFFEICPKRTFRSDFVKYRQCPIIGEFWLPFTITFTGLGSSKRPAVNKIKGGLTYSMIEGWMYRVGYSQTT